MKKQNKLILSENNNFIIRYKRYVKYLSDFKNNHKSFPMEEVFLNYIENDLKNVISIEKSAHKLAIQQLKQLILFNIIEIESELINLTLNGVRLFQSNSFESDQKIFISIFHNFKYWNDSYNVNPKFSKYPIRELMINIIDRGPISFKKNNETFHFDVKGKKFDGVIPNFDCVISWECILSMMLEMQLIRLTNNEYFEVNKEQPRESVAKIYPTEFLENNYNVNCIKFMLEELQSIICVNKDSEIRKSFDGGKVLTYWKEFINIDSAIKPRKWRNIKLSWEAVFQCKYNDMDRNDMSNIDPENYLRENYKIILNYWRVKPNPLVYTGIIYWMFNVGIINLMNIDYDNIMQGDNVKKNIKSKFDDFLTMLNYAVESKEKYSGKSNENIRIRNIKDFNDKEILYAKELLLIEQYRNDFIKNMDNKKYGSKNSIYKSTYDLTDRAHIWEVKDIRKKNVDEWIAIADPDNGLYLEPNIHREWDNNQLILTPNFEFISSTTKEVKHKIKEEFKTEKRKLYISKRMLNINK